MGYDVRIWSFQRVSARRNYEFNSWWIFFNDYRFQRVSARRNYEFVVENSANTICFQRVSARRNYEFP